VWTEVANRPIRGVSKGGSVVRSRIPVLSQRGKGLVSSCLGSGEAEREEIKRSGTLRVKEKRALRVDVVQAEGYVGNGVGKEEKRRGSI